KLNLKRKNNTLSIRLLFDQIFKTLFESVSKEIRTRGRTLFESISKEIRMR
ncbi:24094_t:CDS:1, partial [Racocetra persica]